jgi:hypothetical protein
LALLRRSRGERVHRIDQAHPVRADVAKRSAGRALRRRCRSRAATRGVVAHPTDRRQRAPRRSERVRGRELDRRAGQFHRAGPSVEGHGHRAGVGRLRRHVRPPRSPSHRPVRPGPADPGPDHLAVGQAGTRGPHHVRLRLCPPVHRGASWASSAGRTRRERGSALGRLRLLHSTSPGHAHAHPSGRLPQDRGGDR